MTVSSTNTKNSYSGDASTTVFAYTFKVFDDDDISVILRTDATGGETLQTKGTHYSVSGVGNAGGGNITFVIAPASGITVVLIRATVQTQTTDYTPNDPFPAASHEEALDRLTLMVQDQQEELDRSIKVSRTNTISSTEFTIGASDRANKVFAFDGNGDFSVTQEIGTYKGADATVTTSAYSARDIVKSTTAAQLDNVYIATQNSPSGTSLTNTTYWQLLIDAVAAATSAAAAASSATDAGTAQTAAEAAQAAAETAETNAETAETNAETAETNAETAQTAAEAAQAAAETAETNAGTSETNAATSATASASSASASAASASAASTSETNASTSETNAASSASSASTSASTATTQAGIATTKAGEAATSATNAATSETNAATSESNAASSATAAAASQVSAAASAASAASAFDNFDDTYLGSYATDPTVDNDGDALVQGALYFNSAANEMRVYDGANWIAASSAGGVSLLMYEYTATAAQTTFSGSDDNANTLSYTIDNIIVTLNGITLDPSDYTATSGTSIVLASGAALNDELNVVAFKSFTTADMVSATNGGTFGNDITVTGDLDVTGNVGIGTASPIGKFMVEDGTSSPSALVVRQTSEAGAAALSLDSIFNNASNTDKEVASIKLGVITNGSASPNADIRFETVSSGTLSEAMRITSAGNVGIGKTPSTALDVSGTVTATAFSGDGSGLSNVGGNPPTIQVFTTSGTGTWTKPSGCKTIKVTVVGGGGGGGSARGQDSSCNVAAGGGGAGGSAIEYIDVTSVSSVTVTRGAGGSGGTDGGSGGVGGTSSFGSYCSATGGGGGGGVTTTGNQTGFGGGIGTGSSGDINIRGGAGHHGQLIEGGLPCSGSGGVSIFGGNGTRIRRTSTGGTVGNAGELGGGGSGSATRDQASSKDGGAGGAGIVVVEEYY